MKRLKKAVSLLLAAVFISLCFAGCSSVRESEEITDETMLVAYTQENAPFISKDDKGFDGFDVSLFKAIVQSVKGEYKSYKFVQVKEGYKIGEDIAYTDDKGNEYKADILIGAVQSNTGTINEDYSLTDSLIVNRIITIAAKNSNIKSYDDLAGAKAGVVTGQAKVGLDKNSSIKAQFKSIAEYKNIADALSDLNSGKIDALVCDEFSLHTAENNESYTQLDGELDSIHYVFAVKKWDDLRDNINDAIYELKSPDYNGKDEFTPIVEKYFGYNASDFSFVPED